MEPPLPFDSRPCGGQFGHDATGAHAAGEHVTVVAIGGDDLITFHLRHLMPTTTSFLTDVEVTETTDEAHAIELAGLFFETADQQHFTIA